MNEIRRHDRDADEFARVREIMGRHRMPEFVTGFDIRLGDIDGDPALWVVFRTTGDIPRDRSGREQRAAELRALRRSVMPDLLEAFEDRFPYVRFEADPEPIPAS